MKLGSCVKYNYNTRVSDTWSRIVHVDEVLISVVFIGLAYYVFIHYPRRGVQIMWFCKVAVEMDRTS